MLTNFQAGDRVISTDILTTSTWTNNLNNLITAFTSSEQASFLTVTSSGHFYIDVYQAGLQTASAEVQYAVAYGNRRGSGSVDFTNDTGSLGIGGSRVIYSQYQQLAYRDENTFFTFGSHTPEHIYVINVNRSRYKHNLRPGTLNLHLSGASAGSSAGSQTIIHLTDDFITSAGAAVSTPLGRRFNVVSGSSGIAINNEINQIGGSSSYGHFYPDAGIIILNPDNIRPNTFLRPVQNPGSSTNTDRNNQRLYHAISGAGYFILDSQEKVTSQYYFIRARNLEYNFTNNPSFTDTTGAIRFDSMIGNPVVYITTVGLYNNAGDLVAVAKLSQPITKDFTKEALIRVKLDY
jgi:hypothetical protein